jgi:lipid II isoglutaminyl synthase (glutamine-hydrolysing)
MKPSFTIRIFLARWALRRVNWLSARLGRGAGTVAGGRVGLKIAPDLLERLAAGRQIVLVTGTNGKTTTTALIAAGWGAPVVSNLTGANMPAGLVAALANESGSRVVLETDEAWVPRVLSAVQPAVVVVLNLSRDQMDRANEVRQLAQRLREGFVGYAGIVIANANDPLVVYATRDVANVAWLDVPTAWHEDARSCPVCTERISFEGSTWRCSCGLEQPTAMWHLRDGHVSAPGVSLALDLALPGSFNQANATFALAALHSVGVTASAANERLSSVSTIAGRYSVRQWGEHRIRLQLAKNPAGFNALLETLDDDADCWVAINAQTADGRDPSWLYDVNFEVLAGRRVHCLGERALDIATRLEYAGATVVVGVDDVVASATPVTVLANYTAFRALYEASRP